MPSREIYVRTRLRYPRMSMGLSLYITSHPEAVVSSLEMRVPPIISSEQGSRQSWKARKWLYVVPCGCTAVIQNSAIILKREVALSDIN